MLQAGSTTPTIPVLDAAYQGTLRFRSPDVNKRAVVTVRLCLLDEDGKVLHDTAVTLDIFPNQEVDLSRIYVIGKPGGKATQLADEIGGKRVGEGPMKADDVILIDDLQAFNKLQKQVVQAVRDGARAVFLELPKGKHQIGGAEITVGGTVGGTTGKLHFVSRATGHRLVEGFQPEDFKFWYDGRVDRPSPLLKKPAFSGPGWEPILLSHNALAAGWKGDGNGHWCICQIELAGRTSGNPVAFMFAQRLLSGGPVGQVLWQQSYQIPDILHD